MFVFADILNGKFYNFDTGEWGERENATEIPGSGFLYDSEYYEIAQKIWKDTYDHYLATGAYGTIEDSVKYFDFFTKSHDILSMHPSTVAALYSFHKKNPTKRILVTPPNPYDDMAWLSYVHSQTGFNSGEMNHELFDKLMAEKEQQILNDLRSELRTLGVEPLPAPAGMLAFEDRQGMMVRLAREDIINLGTFFKPLFDAGITEEYLLFYASTNMDKLLFGDDTLIQ